MKNIFKPTGGAHARRTIAVAAAAIALSIAASAAEAPALSANPLIVAQPATLRQGDVMGGRLARDRVVQVTVSLKLRNRDALEAFIARNSSPQQLGVQQTMSAEQLSAEHLPTAAQAQSVVNFLQRAGFRNIEVASNRMLVTAEGSATQVESAFKTTMMQVTASDGRDAFANTDAVTIPAELQDTVLSVLGLQTVHLAHTHARIIHPNAAQPLAIVGHNPTDFSSIYGGSGVPTAAGVAVGIITQGKITQTITDLNTFTANNGLPTVTTQTVTTGTPTNDTSGVVEWNLDSQDIVGMAGGQVGKIIFYNIPTLSDSNLTAGYNAAVSANATKIINVSIGECETTARNSGAAASQDQIFQMAVAQGQTFSISTGDSGADECGNGGTTPSWPAASQFVMAISGTKLDASTTTWNSEVVWNDLAANNGATGGSQSKFEPQPSWQNGLFSGSFRGVADVAFDGSPSSGAVIVVGSSTEQVGGTSLSAPIFAGLWARVLAVKGTSVGFAAPLIYALPASDFHDITSGNNSGSTAGVGYDLATGRGSIILSSAINHIGSTQTGNAAPVANFTFTTNGLTVNFTDASTDSDGTIASRSWNFGDGSTSTATNPSHTYASAGTFSVTLTVTDNGGLTNSKTSSVTVAAAGNKFFQNTTPQAINDNTTITSSIVVSGLTGPAPSNLQVAVNITHTFIGDLVVTIVAPNGASATLWNRQGGSTHNLVRTFTVNASSITNPNGTWQLRVSDRAAGDVGTLNNWSLQF